MQLQQILLKISPRSKNVLLSLSKIKEGARRAIRNTFKEIGNVLVSESKTGISNPPKTGIFYRYKGHQIQSSAVGEYAANRSGKLKGSINSKTFRDRMVFGSYVDYSKFLELGHKSRSGAWVGKRENLLKAIVATRAKQLNIAEKLFARELKK